MRLSPTSLVLLAFTFLTASLCAETRRPLPALSRASQPVLDSKTEFTFAVMGDARPAMRGAPLPRVFQDIVREIKLLRPGFVLFGGDAIFGYDQPRQLLLNEYDRFRAAVAPAGIPFFNAPGNHEMLSTSLGVEALKAMGQALYGSFDVGNYHYIALNTDEVNLEQRVTGEQFDWLREDLELNKKAAGIFVWMHRPMTSWFRDDFNPDDRDALRGLFAKYPVKAVFASHDHYYDTGEHAGIRYFTSGGAGAPLYADPSKGGYAHYILVSVTPENITYTLLEPNHLEVEYTSGNNGLEPVTTARVINGNAADLFARNLELRVPRLSSPDLYRVTTVLRDDEGRPIHHRAAVRQITDNQDGSVSLGIAVGLPSGTGFHITAEAREPALKP